MIAKVTPRKDANRQVYHILHYLPKWCFFSHFSCKASENCISSVMHHNMDTNNMETKMPIKVLIIDDDVAMAELLAVLLKAQGFEVSNAINGSEGVKSIRETSPDLVVVDLMMTEVDGWEVCKRVRTFSNVPILVLSALDSPGMVAKTLDAGADDYLIKPVPSGVLVAHLNKLIRRTNVSGKMNHNNIPSLAIFP
jgi:PleD family two-component response regulator